MPITEYWVDKALQVSHEIILHLGISVLFSLVPKIAMNLKHVIIFKSVTEREAPEIQEKARDQSSSKSCFNERSWRITSSRFGDIYLATQRRNMTKLCQSLVQTSAASFRNEAISHGKVYEPSVVLKHTLALHTVWSFSHIFLHNTAERLQYLCLMNVCHDVP